MAANDPLTIPIRTGFADLLHAARLYRASTSADYPVHIVGGAFSLVVGVCYFALLLAQSYGNQPAAIGSFMIALFLVLAGAVLLFDLISTVLLWIAFRRNRLLYSEPHS